MSNNKNLEKNAQLVAKRTCTVDEIMRFRASTNLDSVIRAPVTARDDTDDPIAFTHTAHSSGDVRAII